MHLRWAFGDICNDDKMCMHLHFTFIFHHQQHHVWFIIGISYLVPATTTVWLASQNPTFHYGAQIFPFRNNPCPVAGERRLFGWGMVQHYETKLPHARESWALKLILSKAVAGAPAAGNDGAIINNFCGIVSVRYSLIVTSHVWFSRCTNSEWCTFSHCWHWYNCVLFFYFVVFYVRYIF